MATRRSFLKQLAFVGLAGGGALLLRDQVLWRRPRATFAGPEASSGWLAFADPRRALVTLDVEVGGAPARALLDSGAQFSAIDAALAERLALPAVGVPVIARGAAGGAQMGRGVATDVRVGGLALEGLRAAVLDLGPIVSAAGLATPLILGQDVLHAAAADIDFPRRRVRLLDPDATPTPPGALTVKTRRQGRALMVEAVLEGAALEVLVDTGASTALALTADVAEAAGLMDGRPARAGASIVLGGVAEGRIVRARGLVLAGRRLDGVDVHVFPKPPLPGFPAGLLGVEALEGFRVLLDLGRGRMLLSEGSGREARHLKNGSSRKG